MRLHDFMKERGWDDDIVSKLLARKGYDVSPAGVRKWRSGDRTPPARVIYLIEQLTDGEVSLRDFVKAAREREAA